MVGLVIALWSHITPSGKAREGLICRGLPSEQFPVESCHCSLIPGPLPWPWECWDTPAEPYTQKLQIDPFAGCWSSPWCFVVEVIQRVDVLGSAPWLRGHPREELLKVLVKKPRKKKEGCGCSRGLYTSLPILWSEEGVAEQPLRQLLGSPFQAEKAGTHHSGFSSRPRWCT